MLCVNTFLQIHAKEAATRAATREKYVGSEMPNVANATLGVATSISPLWNTNFPLLSAMRKPYIRTTATNCDYDATTETPTAATATTTPGADENDDDQDDIIIDIIIDKQEYVNTETHNNIESKDSLSFDIDIKCSKQLLMQLM
jgi:hypothetical protein